MGEVGAQPSENGVAEDETGSEVNWDHMLIGGTVVPTVDAAAAEVSFSPRLPANSGEPELVLIDLTTESEKASTVAMKFTSPAYGMFWLIEAESQTTQGELEALASGCDPAEGCQGNWTLVNLTNGTTALLIEGPEATSMTWLSGSVRFDLMGRTSTFDRSAATEIANSVPS